jgi:hypothetical protein
LRDDCQGFKEIARRLTSNSQRRNRALTIRLGDLACDTEVKWLVGLLLAKLIRSASGHRQSIYFQHLDGFKLKPGCGILSCMNALPVAGIRVVFIGMSPMLRDIVSRAIASEMDMDIAGELFADSWAERLRALKPGAVIISLAHGEGDDVTSRLMEAAPNAKIVALSSDNRSALCCVAGRHQRVLFDVSPQEIAEFISGPN